MKRIKFLLIALVRDKRDRNNSKRVSQQKTSNKFTAIKITMKKAKETKMAMVTSRVTLTVKEKIVNKSPFRLTNIIKAIIYMKENVRHHL